MLHIFRSDHLARHTKIHLQQDKRHVCSDCGKAFNRLDNLKTHQRIHTGMKDNSRLHLCIYCGKEFNNSSNMVRIIGVYLPSKVWDFMQGIFFIDCTYEETYW